MRRLAVVVGLWALATAAGRHPVAPPPRSATGVPMKVPAAARTAARPRLRKVETQLGVVPSRFAPRSQPLLPGTTSVNDLAYHGGPVMRTNTVYAIYWVPPGFATTPNYRSLIDGFFGDVASDNGKTTNVYSTDTQYSDGTGSIAYSSAFSGSTVDTHAFPASGCNDGVDAVCLTDQQLTAEIYRVIGAQGWPNGLSHEYFIFTPQNVGSCFDSSGTECSTNTFCAYHSAFNDGTHDFVYANQPFAGVPGCESGQRPHNDADDDTINVVSHEHNEAITDPLGFGWYNDATGNENGDNCAWNFGAPLGGAAGREYNQVIGTGQYYLQGEWSNASSSCAWADSAAPLVVNTALPAIAGTAALGQTLTASAGTWSGSSMSFAYQWLRCAADRSACSSIDGATATTYLLTTADSGLTLRVSVTAGSGTAATSAPTAVIVYPPVSTTLRMIAGTATVGAPLVASPGSWTAAGTVSFSYRWLRCDSNGASCVDVSGVTGTNYVATVSDVGSALRVVVTASSGSASSFATSAATSATLESRPAARPLGSGTRPSPPGAP